MTKGGAGMAFNADRKFDRLLELMNKIGRTSESFEQRAEKLENSRISYDASTDPGVSAR